MGEVFEVSFVFRVEVGKVAVLLFGHAFVVLVEHLIAGEESLGFFLRVFEVGLVEKG